ncbi:MAG: methyltransferase domain-containing protein [Bacteroidota bacterium]
MNHYEAVQHFFDRTAKRYQAHPGAFRQYYFKARLSLAISLLPDPPYQLLDVGCGPGEVYDELNNISQVDGYFGVDISEAMLHSSSIPTTQRAQTRIESLAVQDHQQSLYDIVLALGLTTYYQQKDLPSFYKAIQQVLAPNGSAIISYTHAHSLDFRGRAIIHLWFGKWLSNRRSLGRSFPIYASSPEEEQNYLPQGLRVQSIHWLPPYFPFSAPARA